MTSRRVDSSFFLAALFVTACAPDSSGSGWVPPTPDSRGADTYRADSAGAPDTYTYDTTSSFDTTPSPASGAPYCADSSDCPYWYCECESGPPVNSAHCTNHYCEDAPASCPDACASFGTCWEGWAGGGWEGGFNAGDSTCRDPEPEPDPDPDPTGCGDGTDFRDLGATCSDDIRTCESGLCYGKDPSFICTKRCDDANECPAGWHCGPTSDGFDICMIGGASPSGPASTNAQCRQASYSDVGESCSVPSNCQSRICMSNGLYCSKRCGDDDDCGSGMRCDLVNSGTMRVCID